MNRLPRRHGAVMEIDPELREVGIESRAIIEGLYQFHRYDLSEYNGQDIGSDGRFAHIDVKSSVAGFALVDSAEKASVRARQLRYFVDFRVSGRSTGKPATPRDAILADGDPGVCQGNRV